MNDYKGRHKFFILAKPSKDKHTPRNLVEVGVLYKLSNKGMGFYTNSQTRKNIGLREWDYKKAISFV